MDTDMLRSLSAQYSDLLNGNDMPSESELEHLKAALLGWRAKVEEIKKTAEGLSLTLAALSKQRKELEKAISTFEPIFSPIRRVPEDVLGEIFPLCLPTHRNPIPINSKAPLVLTRVCRKWRNVALSSPSLWTKVHFSFQPCIIGGQYDSDPHGFNQQCQLRLTGIKSWLSRSGSLPLSISLKPSVPGFEKESQQIEREAIQAFVDHAARWYNLEIFMTSCSFSTLSEMIDINPRTVPILRSLRIMDDSDNDIVHRISTPQYQSRPDEPCPLQTWLSLPTLRSVHAAVSALSPYPHGGNPDRRALICGSNLSTLSIYHPTDRKIVSEILRSCPLLVDCYLHIVPTWWQYTKDLSMILLPNLSRLGIEGEMDTQDSLWGLLSTPLLVDLTLYPRSNSDNTSTLSSFLLRCTLLDKVTCDPCLLYLDTFQSIIKCLPSVSQLNLEHQYPTTNHVEGRRHQECSSKALRPIPGTYIAALLSIMNESMSPSNQVQVMPRLKSLSAYLNLTKEGESPYIVMEFLRRSIRPLSPHPQNQSCFSLESVTLIIDGHPDMGAEYGEYQPIDIVAETIKHARSVGRTLGVDLFLDITYPWKELYEKDAMKEWNSPDSLMSTISLSEDEEMASTWPYADF